MGGLSPFLEDVLTHGGFFGFPSDFLVFFPKSSIKSSIRR
jgi:hypothetical protein